MNVIGYTERGAIRVIFDGDENESFVPHDMGNRHRQMIAEWEADGNAIPAYAAPVEDPLTKPLGRLDFWLVAASAGVSKWSVRDRIAAMPDATPEDFKAKAEAIAWVEEAPVYRRNDPILVAQAEAEGITSEQLDALWAYAVG